MQHFGLEEINGAPSQNKVHPLLPTESKKLQYTWLYEQAKKILDATIGSVSEVEDIHTGLLDMDRQDRDLVSMKMADGRYQCPNPGCEARRYVTLGRFKKHMTTQHGYNFQPQLHEQGRLHSACSNCSHDDAEALRSSFAKCALLLRDTYDAYRHGDGNRIFRNAKFEMLTCDVSHHTKYRLWLWRMLAYECALLSPQDAYEYKWNTTVNLAGGEGNRIANDNLVELNVHALKRKLQAQGANMTFKSAENACELLQVVDGLADNLNSQCGVNPAGKSRPPVEKAKDLDIMVKELSRVNFLSHVCDRSLQSYRNFVDPLHKVSISKLWKWISEQKKRASVEMEI